MKPECQTCQGAHHTLLHRDIFTVEGGKNVNKTTLRGMHNLASRSNHRSTASNHEAGSVSREDENTPGLATNSSSAYVTSNEISQPASEQMRSYSKIFLVDIKSPLSDRSHRCYAVIDEMSTSTFITPELAYDLNISGPEFTYSLSTMSGISTHTEGILLKNLLIRGVGERSFFKLPLVITNEFIPNCLENIASPEDVDKYPEIRKYSKFFNNVDKSLSVMIIIGRDSGDLMKTKCMGNHPPFVHQTNIGWALVGTCSKNAVSYDNSCYSFKILDIPDMKFHTKFCPPSKVFPMKNPHLIDTFATFPDDECSSESTFPLPEVTQAA